MQCVAACEAKAIDHSMKASEEELEVGAVVLSAGFKEYKPTGEFGYGYGRYRNVVTSLEFERILSAPTAAEVAPRIVQIRALDLIGGEIARGERFNLNRPFTAPKPLAYSATHPYYSQRQAYFKDLYTLMVAVTGTSSPPNAATRAKYAQ